MSSMLKIRLWSEADLPLIMDAENACFTDPWTENMITAEYARNDFFGLIAEDEGVFVGYVAATALFEDGEIAKIAVLPDFRGKGFGKLLMDEAFAEFKKRGVERVFLEVREGNVPAVGLYLDCGFQKTRLRKRYYPDGENALEMKKEL